MLDYGINTLDEICINQECVIKQIIHNNAINVERMLDLGFVEGTKVTPLFKSMFGDLFAFKVKDSVIGLRKNDCKYIMVKLT